MFTDRDIILVEGVKQLLDYCIDFPCPDLKTVPKRNRDLSVERPKISLNLKRNCSSPTKVRNSLRSPTMINKEDPFVLHVLKEEDQEHDSTPNSPTISPRRLTHRLSCLPVMQSSGKMLTLNDKNIRVNSGEARGIIL